MACYSDHNEDIRTKGSCDLCGDIKPDRALESTDVSPVDVVDLVIRYEAGETTDSETLELFGHLIRTGQAWQLQGHYGRTATAMIEVGYLDETGQLTELGQSIIDNEED